MNCGEYLHFQQSDLHTGNICIRTAPHEGSFEVKMNTDLLETSPLLSKIRGTRPIYANLSFKTKYLVTIVDWCRISVSDPYCSCSLIGVTPNSSVRINNNIRRSYVSNFIPASALAEVITHLVTLQGMSKADQTLPEGGTVIAFITKLLSYGACGWHRALQLIKNFPNFKVHLSGMEQLPDELMYSLRNFRSQEYITWVHKVLDSAGANIKKRGRPAINGVAMTELERKRRSRMILNNKKIEELSRRTSLEESSDNQVSLVDYFTYVYDTSSVCLQLVDETIAVYATKDIIAETSITRVESSNFKVATALFGVGHLTRLAGNNNCNIKEGYLWAKRNIKAGEELNVGIIQT